MISCSFLPQVTLEMFSLSLSGDRQRVKMPRSRIKGGGSAGVVCERLVDPVVFQDLPPGAPCGVLPVPSVSTSLGHSSLCGGGCRWGAGVYCRRLASGTRRSRVLPGIPHTSAFLNLLPQCLLVSLSMVTLRYNLEFACFLEMSRFEFCCRLSYSSKGFWEK